MILYRKLFGSILLKPLGEDGGDAGGGGGAADRGDNLPDNAADQNTDVTDEDLEIAAGKDGEDKDRADDTPPLDDAPDDKGERARDENGKFTKKDKGETSIPKSRFDDAVRKERERAEAAERRLAEIETQRQQVSRGADLAKLEEDVRELRAEERKALVAGDDKKAAELADKADRLNRQIAVEQARDMTTAAKEQAREEIRWDMTLESIEEQYPALNETSEEFDQDLSDDVIDTMNGIMRRERLPRSQALVRAVQRVMERTAKTAPEPADTKSLRSLDKDVSRKEAAVKKNVDTANRQPASAKKVGADSDKHGQNKALPDINDLSFDEFSALPETTKAKMRGDYAE